MTTQVDFDFEQNWLTKKNRPLVIAHRGGAGIYPENTLFAFEQVCKNYQIDAIEFDIWPSFDGEPIVHHDKLVDRTTDGEGPINQLFLKEIKELDAAYNFFPESAKTPPLRGKGIQVPSFEEVLQKIEIPLLIELKSDDRDFIKRTIQIIDKYDAFNRICMGSFFDDAVKWVRHFEPRIRTNFATKEAKPIIAMDSFKLSFINSLLPIPQNRTLVIPRFWENRKVFTPSLLKTMKKHNIPVYIWTINSSDEMKLLIHEKVDGIITDYPNKLIEVLN